MGLQRERSVPGNPEGSDGSEAAESKTGYIGMDGAHDVHTNRSTPSFIFDSQTSSDDEDDRLSGEGDDQLSNDEDSVPSDTSTAASQSSDGRGPILNEEDKRLKTATRRLKSIKRTAEKARADPSIPAALIKRALDENITPVVRANLMVRAGGQVAERFSLKRFKQASRFFDILLTDLFNTKFRSNLGGMFLKELKVTQIYAIYYMISRRIRDKQTSILADAPGYGKVSVYPADHWCASATVRYMLTLR